MTNEEKLKKIREILQAATGLNPRQTETFYMIKFNLFILEKKEIILEINLKDEERWRQEFTAEYPDCVDPKYTCQLVWMDFYFDKLVDDLYEWASKFDENLRSLTKPD